MTEIPHNPKLKPVEGFRYIDRMCCATCKHWRKAPGARPYCERPGGFEWEADTINALRLHWQVCRRWVRRKE